MPMQVGAGVGAVVLRDNRLLMILRAGSHGAGVWSIPGGWLEPGESPEEACEREVLEETGVVVRAKRQSKYILTWPVVDGVASLCAYVECTWVEGEGEVVEPDKCPEVRWVPIPEVIDLPLFEHFALYFMQRFAPHLALEGT